MSITSLGFESCPCINADETKSLPTEGLRPVDSIGFNAHHSQRPGTPRRPSLLTQQILSSPAIPMSSNTTASSIGRSDNSLAKRPSLKDRVRGSLLEAASRDFASSVLPTGGSSSSRLGAADSRDALSAGSRRGRNGSSTTHISERPSFDVDEHLEELVEAGRPAGFRGRPNPSTRRKTYNEGSSQDDMRSSYTYGTSASGWDRSLTGLTTDDDDGV